MLYVSTRNTVETYTATRTLMEDYAPDGGGYLPFRLPFYTEYDLKRFQNIGFCATACDVIGSFFRSHITPEDVRCAFGGELPDGRMIDRKALLLRLWTNASASYEETQYELYRRLCRDIEPLEHTPLWVKIAVDIACIFALYCASEYFGREVDFAVSCGDFSRPMAVYYCRKMGLPVGKIICITNENGGLWELFTHGTLNCGAPTIHTCLPALDVSCPIEIERLLLDTIGNQEVGAFTLAMDKRKQYTCQCPHKISERFSISVASTNRIGSLILKIQKTSDYILDPVTALCLGGLQDYRANSGEGRETVLISEDSPLCYRKLVSEALGIAEYKLSELI